jgi:Ca2+-binding RTX toxin-like protein
MLYGEDGDDSLGVWDDSEGELHGGPGNDHFFSDALIGSGETLMFGGPGNDFFDISGLAAGVWGGPGNDQIILFECCGSFMTGPVVGGDGDDGLYTQDGDADDVRCGPGSDVARIDLEDTVTGCEVIEHRISGDNGDDTLTGTPYNDIFDGYGGDDVLIGLDGDDTFYPGDGEDTIAGGAGDDWIGAWSEVADADTITCGPGFDTVGADALDVVAADCENVTIYP